MTLYWAAVSTIDDTVRGIGGPDDEVPTFPGFLNLTGVEITQSEYNMVLNGGLEWPNFPGVFRWVWDGDSVEEASDPRPLLTFDPVSVELEVGDSDGTVAVSTADTEFSGTVDLGHCRIAFTDGEGTLTVSTVTIKDITLDSSSEYRSVTPLHVVVKQPVNQI